MLFSHATHLSVLEQHHAQITLAASDFCTRERIPDARRTRAMSAWLSHLVKRYSLSVGDDREWEYGVLYASAANRGWRDRQRLQRTLVSSAKLPPLSQKAMNRIYYQDTTEQLQRNFVAIRRGSDEEMEIVDMCHFLWRDVDAGVNAPSVGWASPSSGLPPLSGASWLQYEATLFTDEELEEDRDKVCFSGEAARSIDALLCDKLNLIKSDPD